MDYQIQDEKNLCKNLILLTKYFQKVLPNCIYIIGFFASRITISIYNICTDGFGFAELSILSYSSQADGIFMIPHIPNTFVSAFLQRLKI